VIKADSLDAIKGLVRLVLQRERECAEHGSPLTATASPELTAQLLAVPDSALLAAIQRHRLESLLHGDPLVGALLPTLGDKLKALARAETMAALALASLTREIAALFERAGIPMLVIKGIPLSLQTTGSLTARGRGDLDLLVDPRQVPQALNLLQSAGFNLTYGASLVGANSLQGRYSRFVSIEISLVRSRGQRQWIDLHWHPSHARGVLPAFSELWRSRDHVVINGVAVSTLALEAAFVHACCHAAADCWMCIRNLVDVRRLSRRLEQHSLSTQWEHRLVRKTCAVVIDCVPDPRFLTLLASKTSSKECRALSSARKAQMLPWRSLGTGEWTVHNRTRYLLRLMNLSLHPLHLTSMLMQHAISPESLVDMQTGQPLSAMAVVLGRIEKLARRIRGNDAQLTQQSDH